MTNATGWAFQDIENVTIEQSPYGDNADVAPSLINGDTYSIAQLYDFVKGVKRKEGGLKYTDSEKLKYLFKYTERNDGVKYSRKDAEAYSYDAFSSSDYYENAELYSYDFLTAQKPMDIVTLPKTGTLPHINSKIDRKGVIALGIKNAKSVGSERGGKVYVKNNYTNRELRIDNESIKHGLDGDYNHLLTNARIGSKIGEVIKSAIPINGLTNISETAIGTYAMVSYCNDDMGREFVAVITVEMQSNAVDSFELLDVTHAVNGRQKKSDPKVADSQAGTKPHGVTRIKATTISIADLLEVVKSTHQSLLSNDVLSRFGEVKHPNGTYTKSALFSRKSLDDVSPRALLADAMESVTANDVERQRLAEYKAKLADMEAAEERLYEVNSEIKELSFAKGKRDAQRIRTLMDEKRVLETNINTYDKMLLRLENARALQGVVEREKAIKNKQKNRYVSSGFSNVH